MDEKCPKLTEALRTDAGCARVLRTMLELTYADDPDALKRIEDALPAAYHPQDNQP